MVGSSSLVTEFYWHARKYGCNLAISFILPFPSLTSPNDKIFFLAVTVIQGATSLSYSNHLFYRLVTPLRCMKETYKDRRPCCTIFFSPGIAKGDHRMKQVESLTESFSLFDRCSGKTFRFGLRISHFFWSNASFLTTGISLLSYSYIVTRLLWNEFLEKISLFNFLFSAYATFLLFA